MLSSILSVAAVAALAAKQAYAQAPANVTPAELWAISAEYDASGFNKPIGNSLAFNIPLTKTGSILTIQYGNTTIENGQAYPADLVSAMPTISITPQSAQTANKTWTIMLVDAAALGDPDVEGFYRHYLANSISVAADQDPNADSFTFQPTAGTVITDYAGPGPIAGTGPHRYCWMLFNQRSEFTAPANLSTPGVPAGHWNVTSYVRESKLKDLIAASFFTVENGAPTASILPTTAVNTATIVVTSAAPKSTSAANATAGVAGAANKANTTSGASTQYYAQGSLFVTMALALIASIAL